MKYEQLYKELQVFNKYDCNELHKFITKIIYFSTYYADKREYILIYINDNYVYLLYQLIRYSYKNQKKIIKENNINLNIISIYDEPLLDCTHKELLQNYCGIFNQIITKLKNKKTSIDKAAYLFCDTINSYVNDIIFCQTNDTVIKEELKNSNDEFVLTATDYFATYFKNILLESILQK